MHAKGGRRDVSHTWTMKRPFLGSLMSAAMATATTKAVTARPNGAARQLMLFILKADARLPPSTTATASPV